jgi:peroxiredoxin (alkyl hydroperoxide reductase subunit C)
MTALPAGSAVPEFAFAKADGESFGPQDLVGKTTVLVFYPFAFSPVCADQLSIYEEVLGDIQSRGAEIYGVSCDSGYAQTAFIEKLGVSIPQLSDFQPKGAGCEAFGVLHPGGFPQRALIVVGPDGKIAWSHQEESPGGLPGANLIFDGLDAAGAAA